MSKYQTMAAARSEQNVNLFPSYCTGDYRDPEIVIWLTSNYQIVTAAKSDHVIHDVRWDPFSVNEFATVGEKGALCFWLLEDSSQDDTGCLSLCEASIPPEVLKAEKNTVRKLIQFKSVSLQCHNLTMHARFD